MFDEQDSYYDPLIKIQYSGKLDMDGLESRQ